MNGDIFGLRQHSSELVEGLSETKEIVYLTPFIFVELEPKLIMLLAVAIVYCTQPFSSAELQKSRNPSRFDVLDGCKLFFVGLKTPECVSALGASVNEYR